MKGQLKSLAQIESIFDIMNEGHIVKKYFEKSPGHLAIYIERIL
jgi:hypothetical protein